MKTHRAQNFLGYRELYNFGTSLRSKSVWCGLGVMAVLSGTCRRRCCTAMAVPVNGEPTKKRVVRIDVIGPCRSLMVIQIFVVTWFEGFSARCRTRVEKDREDEEDGCEKREVHFGRSRWEVNLLATLEVYSVKNWIERWKSGLPLSWRWWSFHVCTAVVRYLRSGSANCPGTTPHSRSHSKAVDAHTLKNVLCLVANCLSTAQTKPSP